MTIKLKWVGWLELSGSNANGEMMESIQKNQSTPQQPILQGIWRGSTPESDLECPSVSIDYRQAGLA